MKIINLHLGALSNEEHFKFHTDSIGLMELFTATALLTEVEHPNYVQMLKIEKEALGFIRKSVFSEKLQDADLLRDNCLKGMKKLIESGLLHFKPEIRDAAERLIILWKTFGSITAKNYKKESGAVIKLITELEGNYAVDVAKLGLSEWLTELKDKNQAFDDLMNNRFEEMDDKTPYRMKEVRVATDAAYHAIINRINALMIVNGEAAFEGFVKKLNLRIEAYTDSFVQRKAKGGNPAVPVA
ncbi:MAG: DUF6261 family protein [Bacteroidales bacterium]